MSFPERLRNIRHTPVDIAIASALVLIGLPLLLGVIAGGGAYLYFFKFSPPITIPEPEGINIARSSHIYAADGSLLATLRGANFRVPIDYSQMPSNLRRAVIASEDSRFFEHQGLDFAAIVKALADSQFSDERLRGASTITQQYVGTVFVGKERTLTRKIREAQIASQLEREVSKEKILERYLNTVYFGAGAYGVEAAANTFFGKSAKDLTLSESAQLVGQIPAPSRYSPYTNPARAEARRLDVVSRMEQVGNITSAEALEGRRDKPVFQEARPTEEILRYPWFVDAVKRYLQHTYGVERTFNGGLEVTTTIDPRMQDLAEKAINEALPSPDDPYASLVSIEPSTGYVKALVGGRDYLTEKYNIAIQGRRQPGSSFKPFVLVAALESGLLPSSTFRGPSTICLAAWRPKCEVSNFDNAGFGTIDLRRATVNSVNTVYAQLVLKVGPKEAVDTIRRMGIPGPTWMPPRGSCTVTEDDSCRTRIEAVPALTLGSEEVTPFEMASAFGTLANRGTYQVPKVVSKITEADGTVIEEGPASPRDAVDSQVADNANAILQGVVTGGTGTRASIGRPAAGKTGTAQDFQNAWFVGYTPELSTSVWVGFKDANKPLLRVQGLNRVTGGTIPAQIWAAFMKPALGDAPVTEFAEAEPLEPLALPRKATTPNPMPSFVEPPFVPFTPEPQIPTPTYSPPPPAPPNSTGGGLLSDLFGNRDPRPSPTTSPTPKATPSPTSP
ncbi:penicillin-binding protein 1A [soil metagenome]